MWTSWKEKCHLRISWRIDEVAAELSKLSEWLVAIIITVNIVIRKANSYKHQKTWSATPFPEYERLPSFTYAGRLPRLYKPPLSIQDD